MGRAFFNRGGTRASLKAEGKTPVVIDKFTISAMTGAKVEICPSTDDQHGDLVRSGGQEV